MIVVIVVKEKNERTGRVETVVSHGVDYRTGKLVVMSGDSPESVGAVFNKEIGEYVVYDE